MINKNQYELSLRQVCLFFIAFLPVTKFFMMPSVVAAFANEDLWLSTIVNSALDFITLFFVVRACSKTNKTLIALLEERLGKFATKTIMLFFLIYFLFKAILPINEQKDYVEYTLYTLTPTLLYFCPFFLVALLFGIKHLRVIGRCSDVLWLVTIIGVVILFTLSIGNMDFAAILPIGANGGARILSGSYHALTWFGDAAYFLFFLGQFEYKKGNCKKILLSFIVSSIMVILFMIVFYSVFTSVAFRQKFALTEISKYATVINNIGRFDYIGIMLILFSNLFALSLPLFFASKLIGYIFNLKRKFIASLISVGIELAVLLVFNQHLFGIETFILGYGGFMFLLIGNVAPVIICLLVKKEVKNEVSVA